MLEHWKNKFQYEKSLELLNKGTEKKYKKPSKVFLCIFNYLNNTKKKLDTKFLNKKVKIPFSYRQLNISKLYEFILDLFQLFVVIVLYSSLFFSFSKILIMLDYKNDFTMLLISIASIMASIFIVVKFDDFDKRSHKYNFVNIPRKFRDVYENKNFNLLKEINSDFIKSLEDSETIKKIIIDFRESIIEYQINNTLSNLQENYILFHYEIEDKKYDYAFIYFFLMIENIQYLHKNPLHDLEYHTLKKGRSEQLNNYLTNTLAVNEKSIKKLKI